MLVVDNGSTDATKLVSLDSEYVRIEHDPSTFLSFREAFTRPRTEWVWSFGDDDLMEGGAVGRVREILTSRPDIQFLHVAEHGKHEEPGRLYEGTFLDLAKRFGFLNICGFISGNICRTEVWRKAYSSPRMEKFKDCAFAYALGLLEQLHDKPCAVYTGALVRLNPQQDQEETARRWAGNRTLMRYVLLADGLQLLQDDGILPEKLPERFFRYVDKSLFTKITHTFLQEIANGGEVTNDDWERLIEMMEMCDDEEPYFDNLRWCREAARGAQEALRDAQDRLASMAREFEGLNAADSPRLPLAA